VATPRVRTACRHPDPMIIARAGLAGPSAGSRREPGDVLERPRPGPRPERAKGGEDGVLHLRSCS
jgi:hypothetical protein